MIDLDDMIVSCKFIMLFAIVDSMNNTGSLGLILIILFVILCYSEILLLVQVDPRPSLDECLLAILIALARHSLSCASAIMECPKLVETVINRLTKHRSVDIYPSTIKLVALLRVTSGDYLSYYSYFSFEYSLTP